jgi:serine phosphatase RsbU (regulator of sigma subunit)
MLVKAIERQLTSRLQHDENEVVSPAKILSIFNSSMKNLLKQETIDSISNAGFDGGVLYYNKNEKYIKFAGAETPLFFMKGDELQMLKGSRHSVGYKKSDVHFEFTEHLIEVEEGMSFYLTTDGYLDQNGGEKGYPFGKNSFQSLLKKCHMKEMKKQKLFITNALKSYQGKEERNDDVTLIGFSI